MADLNRSKRWRMPLFAALIFGLMLRLLWTVGDPFTRLPSYGDVLESIWMLETTARSVFVQGRVPIFIADVFYPQGWYPAGWASGFSLYLIGAPLVWFVSPAFAYNALVLGAFAVSYIGALIWLRKHVNGWLTVALSVLVTFSNLHWFRVHGHLNIVWMLAWMPWLIDALELTYRAGEIAPRWRRWPAVSAAIFWSAMIYATPYGLFFGGAVAAPFLIAWLRRRGTRGQGVLVCAVAALMSLPYLVLFYASISRNGSLSYGLEHAQSWAVSLNALFAPSLIHPVRWVREWAATLYSGPVNEASLSNLGMSGCVLAVIGGCLAVRQRGLPRLHVLVVCVGLCLALGMLLTWNGIVSQDAALQGVDGALWQMGRFIRPAAFNTALAPGDFEWGVPLPGYLVHMMLPYTESARVWGRYANVMLIGMTPLIGLVLMRLSRTSQVVLSVLVVFELFSFPTGSVPMPPTPHPAQLWLARQPHAPMLDVRSDGFVLSGGEQVYAQWFHHQPMVGGLGSYLPPKVLDLQNYLLAHGGGLDDPELPRRAHALGARYLLLHLQDGRDVSEAFRANPLLGDVTCFPPVKGSRYLPYPICAATIRL